MTSNRINRSIMRFAATGAAWLLMQATAQAATAVDSYQDMASGRNGDPLTAALMNASTHPDTAKWFINGPWFVSTRYARNLPGPVVVNGVTYNATNSTRTWMLNTSNALNDVVTFPGTSGPLPPAITVAFYYTTELAVRNYHVYNTVTIMCINGAFSSLQTINGDGKGPYLRVHSMDSNRKAMYTPATPIVAGKTYWINFNYNAAGESAASMAVFDPDRAFAQVGETHAIPSKPDKGPWRVMFGRSDNHGNQTNDLSQAWFSQILIDYTHAAFPLIPSNAAPSGATAAK